MNSLCHKYLNQNILPFVGREGELRRLSGLFREFLEEGESKYALITGESGGGKSRLVREFEDYLTREYGESCTIVHARYLEGNAAALQPIVNAFGATLAHQEHLAQLLRSLRILKGETATANSSGSGLLLETESGPPALQILLDSMTELARRYPLVIILEDVHNIEDLPLFDQFFLGLSSASKFVILTERTHISSGTGRNSDGRTSGRSEHPRGYGSEHLMREIALREERASEILNLTDLPPSDVGRMFQMLFEIAPSERLIETIRDRTSGRPLRLRTMLRQLVSAGVVQYDQGHWMEDEHAELEAATQDAGETEALVRFQRELERLNEHEQIVIAHAALLGEQFDLHLLRKVLTYRLGAQDLSDEIFQRSIDLLTFKSIIRRATPSIVLSAEPIEDRSSPLDDRSSNGCYEFSHQHFWNTVLDQARGSVVREHDLVLAIVWIAGRDRLPLYSSAFLTVTGLPFTLSKLGAAGDGSSTMPERAEYFLHWSTGVVKSLWSQEPQQCLRLLMALRPIRDEITWRFGPDLSEAAMSDLLELHSLLVEALRATSPIEAERDLEHAAVLNKFIQSSAIYSPILKGIAKGKVACMRAILHHGRTSYAEFERWAAEARSALSSVPETNLERARLLTLLVRTKGEALLNSGRLREADALIEEGMPVAQLLAESRFDEYSLYYRVAVNSKLKQDQNAQASELTEQIMALAKQRGNTLVETMFLVQAALAAFATGDLKSAARYCDLGLQNGRRYGIRFAEIMSNLWRMIIAGVTQDPEKVRECSQQLAALVEDARVVAQSPNLLQRISLIEGRATAMNFLGRYHAGLEFAEEAIQLARSHDHESFAAWAQNEKALALVGLGRYEDALAVATASIELAGEQLTARRTARTALIGAYAGLGRIDEARREVENLRPDYKERNPYFLRFALAEARLLRQALGQARDGNERQSIRAHLANRVADIRSLAEQWDAPELRERIQKEFEDSIPKQNEWRSPTALSTSATVQESNGESEDSATIRICTFGSLAIERLDTMEDSFHENGSGRDGRERDGRDRDGREGRERERDRETKVRQLIALLVTMRAEAVDSRTSSKGFAGSGISRETLIDRLWPDGIGGPDGAGAGNAVHTTVKRARAFLGGSETIILTEDGYQLSPTVETDCELVLRHYADARQARKRNALFSVSFHYEQIVRLTDGGPFLEGIYGPWIDGMRSRLATLRRTAALRLIQTDLERGLFDRVEEMCHKLLALDEFDEEALRGLLIVSARRRQTGKLAKIFSDYSQKLKLEFKSEPSADLLALYSDLTTGVAVE
ncbi:MAG: AAA family ATPase [Bacteroidota bacterium]|nr:AAA family ATPase [Bacteroidota bacterium]MDP4232917.1 AAA family ATPase [Bacteroidota bacterium]MDP4241961.1 AAA family ATPase [Bacteroidota bacterium]MDP4286864.1 AAA family ATPase [Bacteroidota bacterium]